MQIVIWGQLSKPLTSELMQKHHVTCFPHRDFDETALLNADVLVVRGHVQITADVLRLTPRLRLIVKAGSGMDNIDLTEAAKRNINVVNTPASTHAVAELTFALLLAVRRNVCFMNDQIREGNWDAKYKFPGRQLHGSTLGIIGFGRIGMEVARLGMAFGMHVLVYDRNPSAPHKRAVLLESNAIITDLPALLRQADALSLHVPLLPETRHLLGFNELEMMKPGSILINTSRAAVVHKQALIHALEEGWIAGAGLDVFHEEPTVLEDPLFAFPQVVCTPHVGAQTLETMEIIGRQVLSVIDGFSMNSLR